jgi:RES domain
VTPRISALRQDDTHRLIPSRHSDESVLNRLAEDEKELQELFELDGATNDRLLGEANLLPGISVHELLFGVVHAHIVNAAFTHAHPAGSRFNGPDRGAWYAAFELETAEAEIAFHKAQELIEINWQESETFTFQDYLADFRADFHDIRGDARYSDCLDPHSYGSSQQLAKELLASGSAGIVYLSVRRSNGTCLVCFRPALVTNVRQGRTVTLAFRDPGQPPLVSH